MIQNYAESIAYLNRQGWETNHFGTHAKNGYEIVFDTSHCVEIYNENNVRVAEGSIESLPDLVAAIDKLRTPQKPKSP